MHVIVTLYGPVSGLPAMSECSYPFPTHSAAVRFARAHGMRSRPAVVDDVTYAELPDAPWLTFLLSRGAVAGHG